MKGNEKTEKWGARKRAKGTGLNKRKILIDVAIKHLMLVVFREERNQKGVSHVGSLRKETFKIKVVAAFN